MPGPTIATIKRLFTVAGNRCAFPGCTATLVTGNTVTAEICHIKAQNVGGPRYDPDQSDKERHAFENLLLLCGDHHKIIDADPATYTVEKLHRIKTEHETRHAGDAEPSDEIIERFLVRIGDVVHGDQVAGDKVLGDKVTVNIKQIPVINTFSRLWRWIAACFVYYTPLRWGYYRIYRRRLITEFHTLNLLGRRPLNLESIYIALQLSNHVSPDLLPDPSRNDVGEQGEDLRHAQRRGQAMDVDAAFGLSSRLVVLGDPGAGKTTLLKHLALRIARGDSRLAEAISKPRWRHHANSPIPIFLTLNDLAREGHRLIEGITAALERHGIPYAHLFAQRALARGHCLCLLDGLDEVASDTLYKRLVREIDSLTVVHPGNCFLVTSRVAGFRYRFQGGFTLIEVIGFNQEQIHRFVVNWFASDPEKAEGLLAALEKSPPMRLLAGNPLLLSVIVLIYELDTKLPERRVELYERCIWVLNQDWERLKGLEGQRRFSPDFTLSILEMLALRFQRGNHLVLERDELLMNLRDVLPRADQADAFLDEVLTRTGLLRQMSRTSYAFTHLTIQEFLAAQAIGRSGDVAEVLGHLHDPWWRETIILLAGLQRDATELVRGILTSHPDALEALILAVCCLTDADETEESLRAEVARQLIARLRTTGNYHLLKRMEGLADMLDEAVWTELIDQLRGPDPTVRTRIAGLLGMLGTERSLRILIDTALHNADPDARALAGTSIILWLQDSTEPAALRVEAIEALGQMPFEIALQILDEAACHFLAGCLTHYDAEIRRSASEALRFAFVRVPAGEFLMGSPQEEGCREEYPQHVVYLPDYTIARYLVTNAQYALFVAATGHRSAGRWREDRLPRGKEGHPVIGVSWHDAMAYCEWLAQETGQPIRLPTEAEWEKAASWDPDSGCKRVYPWGDEFDIEKCGEKERLAGRFSPLGKYSYQNDTFSPVGKYSPQGDSIYGCADMAGNIEEWTSSLSAAYPYQADDGREDSVARGRRVLRGGGGHWWVSRTNYRSSITDPGNRWAGISFRVVVADPFSPHPSR